MFSKIIKAGLGFLTVVSAGPPAEHTAENHVTTESEYDLACQIYGDDDFTHFNLTTLAKTNPEADYLKDGVEFKICERLPKTNYFARVMDMTRGVERLTGEEYEPDDAQAVMDEDGNPWGVVITRQSDNACKSSKEGDVTVIEPYSFTLVVMCDKSNDRVGGGVISQVDKSNPCAPVVTMKHASGCNIWTANWFVRWYHANPWIFAAVQIILGLLIATKGSAMFTNVMTVFSFFLAAKLTLFAGAHYE